MAYSPNKFIVMGESDKPYLPGSQKSIDMLEGITPAEKGQSVPYALLWEIDTDTGKAVHAKSDGSPIRPLSVVMIEPPKFGAPTSNNEFRYAERPPASLERIVVKSNNPRGIILYRTIELSMVVHRPDVVFDEHIRSDGTHVGDADSWSSLVTPGQAFALEYGWSASSGVKNGILNGDGFSDPSSGAVVPGRKQIRFVVVNYRFSDGPDNSLKFTITAYEMGEFNLRQAFLAAPSPSGQKPKGSATKDDIDPYANDREALKKLLKTFQDRVVGSSQVDKSQKKGDISVPFGLLFDVIFAETIEKSFKEMGFKLNGIYVGRFNSRAGKPALMYSGGSSVSNQPLSDFSIPLTKIVKVFQDLMGLGTRLTVYNFIEPFLHLFSEPSVWDRSDGVNGSDATIPQIVMKSVFRAVRGGQMEVSFYLFDTNREFTKFAPDDASKLPRGASSRSDVRDLVVSKGIPYVSFLRANSFVQGKSFEVIQDEAMAGIFMRRYFGDRHVNREQKTGNPDVAGKENRSPAAQQIYSPVLKGRITTIGNFVFDNFNLLWLDFGIKRWDGPFQVYEIEDVIERGNFTTSLSVYSAGTDPLGTQGR